MKRNALSYIALITALLLVGTGCSNDVREDFLPSAESLTIDLFMGDVSTRAVSTEEGNDDGGFNENEIEKLDIFFFQNGLLVWHAHQLSYDADARKATIPVTEEKRSLFVDNSSITYEIHVVANNQVDLSSINEGTPLTELKNIVFRSPDFLAKGGISPQTSFVMDGTITKIVNLNNPDIGLVELKRAASKIRVRLLDVDVPGFTQTGEASIHLVHFTDKSALLEGGNAPTLVPDDWKNTVGRKLETISSKGGKTTSAPFYAYANDWSGDKNRETYLEIYVPLKKNDANEEAETFKYRIPVTPRGLTGDEAIYMNKLQRNFLYDIEVTINILGSREEPPIEITGNYIISDWEELYVQVQITGAHYLVVSEKEVTMPNRSNYTLQFNSSIPDVKLVPGSLEATYTYVDANTGLPVTTPVASGHMPNISVQSNVAAGTITINSPIPINFIPKDIEFKVTNGTLTETITVKHLPATYFTTEKGTKSNLRTQLESTHNNPFMYKITTLAPSGEIIWGFPPLDSNGNTVNSSETANMVSPSFMMASQFGATSPMSYSNGVTNCQNYWEETLKDGILVRYEDWRLPTEAEIKFIDDLQHNANNPQGVVMRGNYYWDAYNGNNAYRMKAPITTSASATDAHVRCIRDIKD